MSRFTARTDFLALQFYFKALLSNKVGEVLTAKLEGMSTERSIFRGKELLKIDELQKYGHNGHWSVSSNAFMSRIT